MSDNTVSVTFKASTGDLESGAKRSAVSIQEVEKAIQGAAVAAASAKFTALKSQLQDLGTAFNTASANADGFSEHIKTHLQGAMEALAPSVASARSELAQVSQGMEQVGHSSTAVRRELIVLAHEMAVGNYSRLGGSLLVLSERLGSIPPVAMAAGAAIAAVGFAAYEIISSLQEAAAAIDKVQNQLAAMGRGSEVSSGAARAQIQGMANDYNMSTAAVANVKAAIDQIPEATQAARAELAELVPAIAHSKGDEPQKIAEEYSKAFSSISGLESFAEKSRMLDTSLAETFETAKRTNDIFTAQDAVLQRLSTNYSAYMAKDKQYQQTNSFAAALGRASAADAVNYTPVDLPTPKPTASDLPGTGVTDQAQKLQGVLAATKEYEGEQAKVAALQQQQTTLWSQWGEAVKEGGSTLAQLQERIAGVQGAIDKAGQKSGVSSQAQAWRAELTQQLTDQQAYGKSALAVELAFWEGKKALASAGTADEREVNAEIYRIRSQMAAQSEELARKGAEAAKQATEVQKRAAEDQLHSLEAVTQEAERGSSAQVTAAKAAYDFATQNALISASARTEAETRYTAAVREQADVRTESSNREYQSEIANLQRKLAADLEAANAGGQRHGLLGSPEQEAANDQRIVNTAMAAIDQIQAAREKLAEDLYSQDPGKASELAQQVTDNYVSIHQEAADRIERANADAAAQVKSEWQSVNTEIGNTLAQGITDAMEGKKGALSAAVADFLRKGFTDATGSVISGLLGSLESKIGASATSPGGLLGSLANSISLGGLFGGGQSPAAGPAGAATGATQDASVMANTTALGTLTTAVSVLNASITSHTAVTTTGNSLQSMNNDAMTVNSSGQQANAAATAENSGNLLTSAATWIENTVATVANTIATDAAKIGALLPFANGGDPPVGVPSLVGERGPELFVPRGAGTIISNQALRNIGNMRFAGLPSGGQSTLSGSLTAAQMVQNAIANNNSSSVNQTIHQTINHSGAGKQSDAESLYEAAMRGGRRGALALRRALR